MKGTNKKLSLIPANILNNGEHVYLRNPYHICPECGEVVIFTHDTNSYGPMTDNNGVNVEGNTYKCSCGCMYHVTYQYDEKTRQICNCAHDYSIDAVMSFTKVAKPVGKLLTMNGCKYTLQSACKKLEFATVEHLFNVGYFNSVSDREKKRFYKKQQKQNNTRKSTHGIFDTIACIWDRYGYMISIITIVLFILGIVVGLVAANVFAFGGLCESSMFCNIVGLVDVFVFVSAFFVAALTEA